jgi:hypothetical protein
MNTEQIKKVVTRICGDNHDEIKIAEFCLALERSIRAAGEEPDLMHWPVVEKAAIATAIAVGIISTPEQAPALVRITQHIELAKRAQTGRDFYMWKDLAQTTAAQANLRLGLVAFTQLAVQT